MKRIFATIILAASLVMAQDTNPPTFSTLVQRFDADLLRSVGLPIPPETPDALVVFSSGQEPGATYRVTLTYSIGKRPPVVNTQDVVADVNGTIRAPFNVVNAAVPSIGGWSISLVAATEAGR